MKKLFSTIFFVIVLSSITFAKSFENDGINIRCLDENLKYAISAFRWYDDDNDGVSELYYFDENGIALKNDDMIIPNYCSDENGKLFCLDLNSKYLQMPNDYVNDSYVLMMTNKNDLEECKKVYQTIYDSIEKFVKYYTDIKLIAINDLGIGEIADRLKIEAEYEIPAYTYGLIATDVTSFYGYNNEYELWRSKIDNLRKNSINKIHNAIRNNLKK